MSLSAEEARKNDHRNRSVMIACGVFVVAMVGMAYAAVPLYDMFCRVTGYNGTTQRVEQASSVILDQKIRVELDTNMASELSWDFKAVDHYAEPKIGEGTTTSTRPARARGRRRTATIIAVTSGMPSSSRTGR